MRPVTVAIIQARMMSSRLPGKVLQDLAGESMLVRVVERVRRAQCLDQVVVATTIDPSDDPIDELCQQRGIVCFRGNMQDVLDRYYQTACKVKAEVIVRVTADCPLIDPQLIDQTVDAFLESETNVLCRTNIPVSPLPIDQRFPYDFVANRLPPPWQRTFPIGLDTEVCSFLALERAWKEAMQKHQREHVMPYLYDDIGIAFDQPSRFRVCRVDYHRDYGKLRWTVDTPPDLELVRLIFARFAGWMDFSWLDVLELFAKEPELSQVNQDTLHKTAFDIDTR